MASSTITVGGNPVTLVAMPALPGLRNVEFSLQNSVAIVTSPFTGQTQAQWWPGADSWSGTMELPPLVQATADYWLSFLAECRGMANPFLLGDPLKIKPSGNANNRDKPVVDGTVATNNQAGTTTLYTRGWRVNAFRLLQTGDYIQVGYRLHRNLNTVTSDASGSAVLNLAPSLREVPADGTPIVLSNPKGLFRLGQNKFTWNADYTRLTRLSFPVSEFR